MIAAALDEIAPRHAPADFNSIGHERRDADTKPALKLIELQQDANPNLTHIHLAGETHIAPHTS